MENLSWISKLAFGIIACMIISDAYSHVSVAIMVGAALITFAIFATRKKG